MAAVQHSIEVQVPITRLYIQLTQFGDYPRFLENVEKVEQLSKTRLHWTTKTSERSIEWDAEVTDQEENHHIVWHNAEDGKDAARIEMDELGPNLSRVRFVLETPPDRPSGITGGRTQDDIARQLDSDLASLKKFLEADAPVAAAGADTAPAPDANELDAQAQADIMNNIRQASMLRTPASSSGSPTEVLDDEPNESGPGMPPGADGSAQACPIDRRSERSA